MKIDLTLQAGEVFEKTSRYTHQMWSKHMRTYTIDLRVDFQDPEKFDLMLEMMRTLARDTMAMALIMADGRQPHVTFKSRDAFEKNDNIEIIEPEAAPSSGE